MWLVYLIALILGGGVLFIQLLAGDHHDVGGDPGTLDDAHPDAGPGIVSTRSATFGLAAFGMVGAPLHILHVLSPTMALVVASAAAAAAVAISGFAFRTLGSPDASGAASFGELVGREGRVLVECTRGARGKIRVALSGHAVDLMATTDEEKIPAGATVKVVDVRDDTAHVSSKEA
jgi:membrane protein implicated in regulation of membrane protease activity